MENYDLDYLTLSRHHHEFLLPVKIPKQKKKRVTSKCDCRNDVNIFVLLAPRNGYLEKFSSQYAVQNLRFMVGYEFHSNV